MYWRSWFGAGGPFWSLVSPSDKIWCVVSLGHTNLGFLMSIYHNMDKNVENMVIVNINLYKFEKKAKSNLNLSNQYSDFIIVIFYQQLYRNKKKAKR